MEPTISILSRTPTAIKIAVVVLFLALAVVTVLHFVTVRCPSYIIKRSGICYFTYYDDLGAYNEDALRKCPKGC